jgi:pSer/pThr/pTyr-binding forkhead associated (FHA) protein
MIEPALELFRKACGLKLPLVLQCGEAGQTTVASAPCVYDCPFVLVGREPRSDLFLDNALVSRRHAFLQAIGGRILVIDLQSRSKVYWEGEAAPRIRGWLDPGRYIQVGPYRIRLAASDAGASERDLLAGALPPPDAELSEAGSLPRATLELPFRVGDSPSLWPVEGRVALVGRSDEAQLVLSDESISRFHAALLTTPVGVWLVDLAAREGLYVNGQSIRWAWLADGDSVRMGRFTCIFRYETPPSDMTRARIPLEAGAALPEQPAADVADRAGRSDDERGALVVRRPGQRAVAPLRAASPPAPESEALVPIRADAWEPAVPIPASAMAMWQQQMQLMESFHNDMIMMVQMFVAMHREHMASVRQELDMVQKLTGELAVLQAKLAQGPASQDADPAGDHLRPPKARSALRVADHTREAAASRADQSDRTGARAEPKATEPAGGATARGPKGIAPKSPAPPQSDAAATLPTSEVHALLTQRIAQLQRERQGYWQRILSSINR